MLAFCFRFFKPIAAAAAAEPWATGLSRLNAQEEISARRTPVPVGLGRLSTARVGVCGVPWPYAGEGLA